MGLSYLKYLNHIDNRWGSYLVCPYNTSKTQFHDHEIQNDFRCKLYKTKCKRVLKQRGHGFSVDLPTEETAMIAKAASDAIHANADFCKRMFADLGYAPFARAVLDDPLS